MGSEKILRHAIRPRSLQSEDTGTDDSDTARLDISSYGTIVIRVYDKNFQQQDELSACIPASSPSKCTIVSLRK